MDQFITCQSPKYPANTNIPAIFSSATFQTAGEMTYICSNYKAETKAQGYVATQAYIFVPDGVGII